LIDKNSDKKLNVLQKAGFLIKLINGENVDALTSEMSAFQLKEFRNFLEDELLYLSPLNGDILDRGLIRSKYPSVHNYYYTYDCREELDDCHNETCLDVNPNCFSRKMKEQIEVLSDMLAPYLAAYKVEESAYEKA
jgi:hypothetical protein